MVLFLFSCQSEFNSIEQAKNEVNKQGYREGRWVDFYDNSLEMVNDVSKGYEMYSLSEFKDGKMLGSFKLFNLNGKIQSEFFPFDDDVSKFEKNSLLYDSIFKKIHNYDENGKIHKVYIFNKEGLLISELLYGKETGTNNSSMINRKYDYFESGNKKSLNETIYFNNGDSTSYYIKYMDGEFWSNVKDNKSFIEIFESKIKEECNRKDINTDFVISQNNIKERPYSTDFCVLNSDTIFVYEIFKREIDEFNNNLNKTTNHNVNCKYCGRVFNKRNGYVFNLEITRDHCSSYNHYSNMIGLMMTMGLSRKYLESSTKYYCSKRCCDYTGYRVWDN
jgi:hypothetical protein